MDCWRFFVISVVIYLSLLNGVVIALSVVNDEPGLYSKSDQVIVLTQRNFESLVYGQKHALLVQFYNSYCGHCRAFAPKYKNLAAELTTWKNILKLAAMDCSEEENVEVCRQFEIMAYPSLRYLHERYVKGNTNLGERIPVTETTEKLKTHLIAKLKAEKSIGRLSFAPSLTIASHATYASALSDVPNNVIFSFLIFENDNSTIGSELALDLSDYENINIKRVYDTSELADIAGVKRSPGLVAVGPTLDATALTPINPTKKNLLKAINTFLRSKNYAFPLREKVYQDNSNEYSDEQEIGSNSDLVYYSDLEKTLKTSLHTEITKYKILSDEALQALLNFLKVLISSFPFRGNLKEYILDLHDTLSTKSKWGGSEIYDLVKKLETDHLPVYTTHLDYIGCKGSQPQYRGYTCGLWTLFHTLTVNAAMKPGTEGPKVLSAMHGYISHFFGCTNCVEHFQAMSERNRIFEVKDNDKAILWLWISHNEVNLRLAGTVTEDPDYPKIQYPSARRCPNCRQARGAWNLPAVYEYLQTVYGSDSIQTTRQSSLAVAVSSPLSTLDLGMLSLLYILSFVIIILVIKYFLTKRLYRKRPYKHGWGKV